MKITLEADVELTVELLAKCFAELDDDQMCKFFVEVARISKTWKESADNQWYCLGGHLRNSAYSTDEAREMIDCLHRHMHTSTHQ